ncbi:MAG TPA: 50S ribosomal protein L3 [Ktedonobacterales bacterium]|nr:50S ribosomal protein L3 [Ktedonobacterales bacterium]
MLSAMLGRKVGMTQVFGPAGMAIPVTVIEAGPCTVTQVKSVANDGYEAIQLGFGKAKLKNTPRPELGHLGHKLPLTEAQRRKQQRTQAKARQEARKKKAEDAAAAAEDAETSETATETEAEVASTTSGGKRSGRQGGAQKRRGLGPFAILREVAVVGGEVPALGEQVFADLFAEGERVDVIGTSKGKGFAGVMKRHGFRGGPRTHGQSDRARAPGSIGPGTTPGRVFKGTRMAGRMGNQRVTIKSLEIIQADRERNLIVVMGSIPGPNGSVVMIRKSPEALAQAARGGAGA